jgi:hypothetical protein
LDPESAGVVGHDRERVAADVGLARLDDPVLADGSPAFVHAAARVQHAGFGDRRMHGDQARVVHAEVRAQRAMRRVLDARVVEDGALLRLRPQRLRANSVLVPALHRAAAARSFVVLAGPFVVAAREVVEHVRADDGRIAPDPVRAQQIVRDGGEPEARACALLSLVEDRHLRLAVIVERSVRRHFHQRGLVHQVAEIQRIGPRVEDARRLAGIRHGSSGAAALYFATAVSSFRVKV